MSVGLTLLKLIGYFLTVMTLIMCYQISTGVQLATLLSQNFEMNQTLTKYVTNIGFKVVYEYFYMKELYVKQS